MGGWADSWRSRPQRQRVRLVPPGTSCCPPRLSFSRCAHCSACAYYQLRLLLGGPNDMARTGSVCARPRCSRCVPSRSTPSPTPVIAFCCLREITRHLHRGCAKCGEPPSLLVSGLSTGVLHVGNRGTTGSLRPQSRTVARMSTGLVPGSGDNAGTSPPRPPQNLQQAIHTHPQTVDEEMTVRTCPHRFPQVLSTSV